MKILSMAWTIYDERMKEFSKDYTGGGLMIKNICDYIGKYAESYLFIGSRYLQEQRIGNICITGTDYKLNDQETDTVKDGNYIRNMTEKFSLTVEKIHPDMVHFHGLGELMQQCIRVCINKNVPYVYTEHLYIGMHRKIEKYDRAVEWEKALYSITDLPVIAVSHGVKKRILQDFPQIKESAVHVIPNGTDFVAEKVKSDILEKYQLQNQKVLLCVGTILVRKNQIQVVEAFMQLPEEIKSNLKVIFCGKDRMEGCLQEKIVVTGLDKNLIYTGAISNPEMKKYYTIADGPIMPSLAEGLSIAALEAIAYGLPVIMHQDSECADDLNDENVVCFAQGRSSKDLAKAMVRWYQKEWDRESIVRYSKKFTMERVAKDYLDYYTQRLSGQMTMWRTEV